MNTARIIFAFTLLFFTQVVFSQEQDTVQTVNLRNEIGIDGEFNRSIISVYYSHYLGQQNKFNIFGQVGGSLNANAIKNYTLATGGQWFLKPSGKSLTVGVKLYYHNINEQGQFFDGIGVEYYSKKGYELSIAPEIGYTFLIQDKIRIYPYIVPFAYSYVSGTDTRTYNYNSEEHIINLSDEQSTISQSLGIKVGLRF
jgi:hypothetical protein